MKNRSRAKKNNDNMFDSLKNSTNFDLTEQSLKKNLNKWKDNNWIKKHAQRRVFFYFISLPFEFVNVPHRIIMKSTSAPIPNTPPVKSQIRPVPILPTTKRWIPNTPKKKQINARPTLFIYSPTLICFNFYFLFISSFCHTNLCLIIFLFVLHRNEDIQIYHFEVLPRSMNKSLFDCVLT